MPTVPLKTFLKKGFLEKTIRNSPEVAVAVDKVFRRRVIVLKGAALADFDRHPVTVEIEKGPDATRGVVDVQILNNTFENYGGVSITGRGEVGNVFYIKNASDLLIRGNRIGSSTVEGTPLILEDTESISWEDNLIHGRPLKALINMASIKE